MSDLNSLLLVYKAQSGDCQAFTALIEPHLRRFYATAMEITKNHEDAEDACRRSRMKAFLHIRTLKQLRVKLSDKLGNSMPLGVAQCESQD